MATVVSPGEAPVHPVRRALKGDFVRHSVMVFAATTAGNALNYLFNFALSRRLGLEGFATLTSLVSFLAIVSIPASILTLLVVKYTALFHATGDTERVRRLSQVLLKSTSIAAVCLFSIGLFLKGYITSFLRIPNDATILLCLGIIALGIITPSVRAILQGEQDFTRYSVSTVLEVLLKVLIAVCLVYAGFGVVGAMLGWILGTSCALAYTIWAVLRKHGSSASSTIHLGLDTSRLIQTTTGIGMATGLLTLMSYMDVLMVKHYFEPRQAGVYAAVSLTGKIVLFLAGFVPAVLLPKAVAKSAKGENAAILLLQAVIVTTAMSGAALTVFGLLPTELVRVLAGSDFLAAAPYVFQYDASMCLLALVTLFVNFQIGMHRFEFLWLLSFVLAGEIVAIVLIHRTLLDVIHVLLAGNAVATLVCGWGLLGEHRKSPSPVAL